MFNSLLFTTSISFVLAIGLLFGSLLWMDREQGARLGRNTLTDVAAQCASEPTNVAGKRIQRYSGTLVSNPVAGPGTFGSFRSIRGGPTSGKFIELDDGELLVMTAGLYDLILKETADKGDEVSRPVPLAGKEIGDRVSFCATIGAQAWWWKQTHYTNKTFFGGGGPIYGQPTGPYPTARWIMDLEG